jgi:ubiquinone/menaquinone biosynthesis C-methylase UbiE
MGMDREWQKFYDKLAAKDLPEFRKGYWTNAGYNQLLRITLKLVRQLPDKPKSVLDVGCGIGRYCHELSMMEYNTLGVDYSELIIEDAKKRFPKLNFQVENGYALSFTDKSFDLVLSIGALQVLENYKKFVDEICRVSGKYVIVSTLLCHKERDLDEALKELLKYDKAPTRDYHPDQLGELFEKNGFKVKIYLKEDGKLIRDGFFIVATRI